MIGGGWTNGYKELLSFMAPPLNAAGKPVDFTFKEAKYGIVVTMDADLQDDPARQSLWQATRRQHYINFRDRACDYQPPRECPAKCAGPTPSLPVDSATSCSRSSGAAVWRPILDRVRAVLRHRTLRDVAAAHDVPHLHARVGARVLPAPRAAHLDAVARHGRAAGGDDPVGRWVAARLENEHEHA